MKKHMLYVAMLTLALGLAMPATGHAWDTWGLNNSEQPGSVLVFPKFRFGTQITLNQGVVPNTEFEISVKCPTDFVCDATTLPDYPNVKLKGHWVCEGDFGDDEPGICKESDFELNTTVNGTLYLTTEPLADPVLGTPVTGVNQANGLYTKIPGPPCGDQAYLIFWVIDAGGNPIRFDGLIGDALVRRVLRQEDILESYNAVPIQGGDCFATGDRTAADTDGGLEFDGCHYKMVTATIVATVRYEGPTYATAAAKLTGLDTGEIENRLSLLTLDVLSNRRNEVTYVDFDFYREDEFHHSSATTFVCYKTDQVANFDEFLTNSNMGRKGLMVGAAERQDGGPVTLIGLLEVLEDSFDSSDRAYANELFNDGLPVPTTFVPNEVGSGIGVGAPRPPDQPVDPLVKPLAPPPLPPLPKLP
jgi:hypothetical protein